LEVFKLWNIRFRTLRADAYFVQFSVVPSQPIIVSHVL